MASRSLGWEEFFALDLVGKRIEIVYQCSIAYGEIERVVGLPNIMFYLNPHNGFEAIAVNFEKPDSVPWKQSKIMPQALSWSERETLPLANADGSFRVHRQFGYMIICDKKEEVELPPS